MKYGRLWASKAISYGLSKNIDSLSKVGNRPPHACGNPIPAGSAKIIGVHVGGRSRENARNLWKSPPPIYRQCAVCCTDFWDSYEKVLPSKRHRSVDKETGKTNHVERLNNTARQRVARLVRNTLSFSKKLENHIGAIWCFVHGYNASLQATALLCRTTKTTTVSWTSGKPNHRQVLFQFPNSVGQKSELAKSTATANILNSGGTATSQCFLPRAILKRGNTAGSTLLPRPR